MINPRLTKGGGGVVLGGTTLPGGRVSRQSQRVREVDATFSVFRK